MLYEPINITLFNGNVIKSNQSLILNVNYKNKIVNDTFYVISYKVNDVILGRNIIEKFNKLKEFPIHCKINTILDKIVSWSRPIKNLKDKNDFKDLIFKYEKDKIVERSRSLWLNPVVLNRKKQEN
ncbi:hypothetical protein DMUE_1089 [Dictyocoela muelleri]|nr:hypothetical protein DMUE_1089 [Dictyocoela muelleri]